MIKAILIKRQTEDKLMEINDDVELGKEYMINPAEVRMSGFNHQESKYWERKMVLMENGTWFPAELLNWEGKSQPPGG